MEAIFNNDLNSTNGSEKDECRFPTFSKVNEIMKNIKESVPKKTKYKEDLSKRLFTD